MAKIATRPPTLPIEIGDKVKYSAYFLAQIGVHTGEMPQWQGVVTSLKVYPGLTIATVDSGFGDEPVRVGTGNLALVGQVDHSLRYKNW